MIIMACFGFKFVLRCDSTEYITKTPHYFASSKIIAGNASLTAEKMLK
jgi:hypothetical protein